MTHDSLSPRRVTKRCFDLLIAALALILLALPLAITALVIRLTLGAPVLYRQTRPGLHEKPFILIKFRTMSNHRDPDGHLLPDSERITRVGSFLRKASLDELPALMNVVRGDLSIVGPRPLLTRYAPFYTDRERLRFCVKPGITGLAQVTGRNTLPWNERLALDVEYVENWSLYLDLKILCQTIGMVLTGTGVTVVPNSAMKSLDEERTSR